MKNIQWIFVLLACLAAASIMGIGIFISEGSLTGVLLSIVALIFIMGFGFMTKKKSRENNEKS
ncbi:YlaF family protein [Bacillus coahuilensis]|uniref:YlaF family protein n=1 Tax=Bacillus coahuilensis TaxID=408580 RepID=UPI0001850BF9|nr:YlaF family protein [Bacillus coahuilensis]